MTYYETTLGERFRLDNMSSDETATINSPRPSGSSTVRDASTSRGTSNAASEKVDEHPMGTTGFKFGEKVVFDNCTGAKQVAVPRASSWIARPDIVLLKKSPDAMKALFV